MTVAAQVSAEFGVVKAREAMTVEAAEGAHVHRKHISIRSKITRAMSSGARGRTKKKGKT